MAKRKKSKDGEERLRAKYNRGSYKSLNGYLDAVYKQNKTKIDAAIPSKNKTTGSSKSRFKQSVIEYMEEGKTVNQALDALKNSRVFTSEAEHYANNVIKALKADKDLFKGFRKLSGWNQKIDSANLEYVEADDKTTLYRYTNPIKGNIVYVRFRKSPKKGLGASIEVYMLEEIV